MTDLDALKSAQRRADAQLATIDLAMEPEDRQLARRVLTAAAVNDQQAAASAAQAAQETAQERARILAAVMAGKASGRARQALHLALGAAIGPDALRGLLATMPLDSAATLAMPSPGTFGSAAAQTERRRIATVFASPVAASRFDAAVALTLQADQPAPAEAVIALLSSMPEAVDHAAAFRARVEQESEWFGAGDGESHRPESRAAAGWRKAVAEANRAIGAAPIQQEGQANG